MQETIKPARRRLMKMGAAALASIPLMVLGGKANAATNAQMRAALKYQDKPNGDKACAGCMQFVPGSSAKGPGGCKVMAGDTEISPTGYCTAWVAAPKK